jgi:hypothetical protein
MRMSVAISEQHAPALDVAMIGQSRRRGPLVGFGLALYRAYIARKLRQWHVAEAVYGHRNLQPRISQLVSSEVETMHEDEYTKLVALLPELDGIKPANGILCGPRPAGMSGGNPNAAGGKRIPKTLYAPRYEDAA